MTSFNSPWPLRKVWEKAREDNALRADRATRIRERINDRWRKGWQSTSGNSSDWDDDFREPFSQFFNATRLQRKLVSTIPASAERSSRQLCLVRDS